MVILLPLWWAFRNSSPTFLREERPYSSSAGVAYLLFENLNEMTKCWIDHQLTHFGLPCYNRLDLFVSR